MSETFVISQKGLEVMKTDLGKMNWKDAKKACENLGDDWRLPTREEFKTIYKYKYRIGSFKNARYWTIDQPGFFFINNLMYFFFAYGGASTLNKFHTAYVRAVRDL